MAPQIRKFGAALMATLFAGLVLTSCDSQIFDYEGDCSATHHLKFKYDMNMKFADAFYNEVTEVRLFVYDAATGKLLRTYTEKGEALRDPEFAIDLFALPAGTYEMVAWCGDGLANEKFELNHSADDSTPVEGLTCTMLRENTDEHPACVVDDLNRLYHGRQTFTLTDEPGSYTHVMPLVKNTNVVRIILQHLDAGDVDPSEFDITITDDNGKMAYDNSMLSDQMITYHPWSVQAVAAGVDSDVDSEYISTQLDTRTTTQVDACLAELTVCRLMADKNPILTVKNAKTGELVLSIPVKDYALMVKGNYNRAMSDQEYLDRQDEYNMTFFLSHGRWVASTVIINSWHVVLQNDSLE
ncbi:MAG: FimB/Mfa2 family fimbrial subunit [Alistipes sp.]|nr:FimB/Mfa2 family fimbrial subunit [Alistipes sp.]